ncbi:uncharacterized protein LOC130498496 isoform X2 [Raphanus sativus]|uniref:Uncharacterized protein LOC130498496 isoform X2 n=1 Tax=Raphanus sativus TaxID=3726 RepID=A0A9W3C8N9_RAPSA|nr:uncharacterized protein LOC130498496 isoform X2 [Raphanus sativus]
MQRIIRREDSQRERFFYNVCESLLSVNPNRKNDARSLKRALDLVSPVHGQFPPILLILKPRVWRDTDCIPRWTRTRRISLPNPPSSRAFSFSRLFRPSSPLFSSSSESRKEKQKF